MVSISVENWDFDISTLEHCVSLLLRLFLHEQFRLVWFPSLRIPTFSLVSLHQTVPTSCRHRLRRVALRTCGPAFARSTSSALARWALIESQGSEEQPGVVVDVGLDEPLPVADPDGHSLDGQ